MYKINDFVLEHLNCYYFTVDLGHLVGNKYRARW